MLPDAGAGAGANAGTGATVRLLQRETPPDHVTPKVLHFFLGWQSWTILHLVLFEPFSFLCVHSSKKLHTLLHTPITVIRHIVIATPPKPWTDHKSQYHLYGQTGGGRAQKAFLAPCSFSGRYVSLLRPSPSCSSSSEVGRNKLTQENCKGGVPFGVYAIVQNFNFALKFQPQAFASLTLIAWGQTLYYHNKWRVWTATLATIALAASFGIMELILILTLRGPYSRGVEWPMMLMAISASVIQVIGLIPPYFELAKRNGRVIGIGE
ncbi:PQ-loop-like protein [Alternaria alternata]|nr:PQ-loop-like protein [Alternaria alternata]